MKEISIIDAYLKVLETVTLEIYCLKGKNNTINYISYKLSKLIEDIINNININIFIPSSIKDKINANNYIILGNNEYLVKESIIANIVYLLLNNLKLIYESLDIYIFYKSKLAKREIVSIFKFLIPILTEYIREKEKKPPIFNINSLAIKIVRKFIRAILYTGKYSSVIGIILCILQIL